MSDDLSPLQQSLVVIQSLKKRVAHLEEAQAEPIAIVGMGCRFPGDAYDPDSFWRNLMSGTDCIGDVPQDRWDMAAYYDADPSVAGKIYARQGAFLRSVDMFDAAFFGISAREATGMDPQQRLLLEVAWETLENAGEVPARLDKKRVGVFVGVCHGDYARFRLYADDEAAIEAHDGTGNGLSFTAGRLSYFLGVQGPSLAVDTACSSSLVSVHLACQSLRSGECEMALAGGVQTILSPEASIVLSRTEALSPDGRCRTFDAGANGFGRGEGCGVIALKRLSDALRDGNRIVSVILGSAVNHDGPSGGLTVPNQSAQENLIRDALSRARVAPAEVGYIECHGTGTVLGDPIELEALGSVFSLARADDLIVGSVKTNVGHLEAAAGIVGLMKAALSVERGQIPAHLHLSQLNPRVDWAHLRLSVPTSKREWPQHKRRIAGVSSFGMSGTNAHIVLADIDAPSVSPPVEADGQTLILSARSEMALRELAGRTARYLAGRPDLELADVAWTLSVGRARFPHWLTVQAGTIAEAAQRLQQWSQGAAMHGLGNGVGTAPGMSAKKARRIALPTYPFERERYWIERVSTTGKTGSIQDMAPTTMSHRDRLQATPSAMRMPAVRAFVTDVVRGVLSIPDAKPIDPMMGFFDLGLDSMLAVDLRRRLEVGLGESLPATLAFEHPTVASLSDHLARDVLGWTQNDDAQPTSMPEFDNAFRAAVSEMSEEDVEALLAERLKQL